MECVSLFIAKTANRGRGVFTETDIPSGTVVEDAPVIVMSKEDRNHLDKTLLHDYIFEWGANKDQCCIALGSISVFNHSYASNCDYLMNYADDSMQIKTVRDVKAGEELTINYNGDWNDASPLWFDAQE